MFGIKLRQQNKTPYRANLTDFFGGDILDRKKQALRSLAAAMDKSGENFSGGVTADIFQKLINERSAKKRKKILEANENLIGSEMEIALIREAAKGNVNALKYYLKNRMPDKYSDKPQTEIEIEDVSEVREMIDNAEDQSG